MCDDERLVGDFAIIVFVGQVLNKVAHLCVIESFGAAEGGGWGGGGGWGDGDGDGATPMFFRPRLIESDVLLQLFVFFFS